MYTYFRDMKSEFKREMQEKGRIIANVKIVLRGKKEVAYISPQGYSVIDVGLLYHAIKNAAPSDLEQFKKTGRMPFSNGYIDISKKKLD